MSGFVVEHCKKNIDLNFVIEPFRKRVLSYGELLRQTTGLANYLFDLGVVKGERVILCFDNQSEYIIAHFTLLRLGAIAVPIPPDTSEKQIKYIVEQTEPKIILYKKDIVLSGNVKSRTFELTVEWLESHATEHAVFRDERIDSEQPIAILYTSGTTDRPKGVVMKFRAVITDFLEFGNSLRFDTDIRFIQSMPIYHADGWCYSLILPFLFGSTVLLTPPFNALVAAQFDNLLNQYGGNVLIAVPSMLTTLLAMKYRYSEQIEGKMKYVLCGSSKLRAELVEQFEREFKTRILENYGLTEALLIAYYRPEDKYINGSVGKVANAAKVRIAEDGEILVNSPFLFQGYYRNIDLTKSVFDGTWFHTGDIGSIDEEGNLYLIGRKRDVINKSGNKIDPFEIEQVLLRHPIVQDVATIGVEDAVFEQEIYSFVVVNEQEAANEQKLLKFVRENLPQIKWPRKIIILPHIPRSKIGKVLRDELVSKLEFLQT